MKWKITVEYVNGKKAKYEDAHLDVHDSGMIVRLSANGSDVLIPVSCINQVIVEEME